ncbi:3-phenylpropionate MFS transporter [Emcibacteraceae bacterium]|jgi:PPP family 3-phenylpropionic acid transporter|nr:3-phenylpropionate MFS transporter [Emcibacteraceae bacterium]MDA9770642.1 3-phenylpropionate MFS transporter [Emcibacteraceae bacterium]MDC1090423.1 3-phenylpropionate MFS transporter [Emcibacteraceae bacterium]
METSRTVFSKLALNYTSMYIYLGVMTPFWAIWLKYKGLSPSEIGVVIAIPYIIKIIVAPLISQTADRRKEYRRPLILCVLSSVVFSTFYFFSDGFWMLLTITVLVNLTYPAIVPLMETITVAQTSKHKLRYGRIRSFGSFSFIFAAVVVGWLIGSQAIDAILYYAFGSLLVLLMSVMILPSGNKQNKNVVEKQQKSPIKDLLYSRDFLWFLCIVGLLQASHGVYYSMGSIFWQENGLEENIIGFLWAVGVVAEILFFVFGGGMVKKYPISAIFAVIGLMGVVRWVVMASTVSLPVIFIVQLLHGFTFGASHLVAIEYIGQKVLSENAGTAQSLYSSLPLGLGMGLATYAGGLIYEKTAGDAYLAMAGMCFAAFLASVIRFYRKK